MKGRITSVLRMRPPVLVNRGLLFASGDTVPDDGDDGYQTGCLYQHTDGGDGTALYVNEGSVTSCTFVAIEGGNRLATNPIVFSGTQDAGQDQKLIDFDDVTLADGSRNNLWSFGDTTAKEVTITDYFLPVRMNIASVANPGTEKLASLMFLKFATTTVHQANLDIQGIGLTIDIGKNVKYVHGIGSYMEISETSTVTEECAAIKAMLTLDAGKTLTAHTTTVLMAEVRGTGSYATSGGPRLSCILAKVGTGTTVRSMIEISNSGTATNGIFLSSQGGITNAFKFGGIVGETGAYVGAYSDGAQNSDGLIKINVNGTSYYIPFFGAGKVTGEW